MAVTPQAFQQMADELASARAQIIRISSDQDALRAQAQQAIAASEARTQALVASMSARDTGREANFDIVDFKVAKPDAFSGRRDESWKVWSRQFKTYCNVRKSGFKQALEWAEKFQGTMINDTTIDEMGWLHARTADTKLYDFLVLQCKQDALVIVEHYDGLGFEAWRQLARRFSPSGGQYELDMMNSLMNPKKASKLADLPGAILRFERDIRTYESRTGRAFPEEWESPTFLRILPDSHREELVRRFQMGTRDYATLSSNIKGFSQEAWFAGKGPNDMDLDTAELQENSFDFQGWAQQASFDEFVEYWEQQHQQDEDLDYLGARGGGRGGGRGGRGRGGPGRGRVPARSAAGGATDHSSKTCFWCGKKGHIAADCRTKQAGKPKTSAPAGRPMKSLEQQQQQQQDDYQEALMGDRQAGSIEFGCRSLELVCGICADGDDYVVDNFICVNNENLTVEDGFLVSREATSHPADEAGWSRTQATTTTTTTTSTIISPSICSTLTMS